MIKKPRAPSPLEETLLLQLRASKLPLPLREYRFHATRQWRFDFAWPVQKFAVECEGGLYINGGHVRGRAYESDLEKYHHALLEGWTVYRCAGRLIESLEALMLIEKMLARPSSVTRPISV